MIRVENLRKIYNQDKSSSSVGLYHVTFTLPSKGMVFVVGKSGSGKSTLLNILGGLDSSSGGNIIIDGNDFSFFSEKDFDNYRNNYLGFIFQDFHLIDSLTVRENIKISLDLQGIKKTKKRLKEVLKQVDLEGYENRYPRELSGGQQQRVAIARAIIKKPKLILADEPTGNLDSKTARSVMHVLKKLSKDTLVVVVSHNDEDAQIFADRIIELSDGRVIRDVERKSEEETKLIVGNTINIPYNRKLNHEEKIIVNNALKTGKYKVSQQADAFTKTKKVLEKEEKVKLKSKRMRISDTARISNKFTKGHYGNSIFTSIIMSLLVILISVCYIFSTFDGNYLIDNAVKFNENTNYILTKGYYTDSVFPTFKDDMVVPIKEEEIQDFYNKGYEGNVYRLYNKTILFSSERWSGEPCRMANINYDFSTDIYPTRGQGVLQCDEQFLKKKFSMGEDLKVLAGSLDPTFKEDGLVITDFAADCLITHFYGIKGDNLSISYENIIKKDNFNLKYKVKAIIETNYKIKYAHLIEKVDEINKIEDYKLKNQEIEKMKKSQDYTRFVQEINDYLAIGYYIGELNYNDAIMLDPIKNQYYCVVNNCYYTDEFNNIITNASSIHPVCDTKNNYPVKDGEMLMPYKVYNRVFNTNITPANQSEFEEKTIKYTVYSNYKDTEEKILIEKVFVVTGVTFKSGAGDAAFISPNDYRIFLDYQSFVSALYFDDVNSISSIYVPSTQNGLEFYCDDDYFSAIYKILDIVVIFNELFILVVIGLIAISFMLMTGFARRSVKRKQVDIGILKAIGGENKHIFFIFFYQMLLITVLVIIFSILGMQLLDGGMNKLLVYSFMLFLNTDLIKDMVIIKFNLPILLICGGVVFVITLITSSTILNYLKKLKPIDIIRNSNKGI